MKKTVGFFVALIVLQMIFNFDLFACSAMLLKGEGYCAAGFNENWKSMDGMILENKRHVEKTSVSWDSLTGKSLENEKRISWISKYGSVSFTCMSKEFTIIGVNEKGLFIAELYLANTRSPDKTEKARMFWGQWIQYQLDNYANIKEMTDNLEDGPIPDWWPKFSGSQLFVADAAGHCANVTQVNGKFKVYQDNTMPVTVLANDPYEYDLEKINQYKKFGGDREFLYKLDLFSTRFERAAHLVENYPGPKTVDPVSYVWQMVKSIYPGQWQLVVDFKKMRVYFCTDIGREIKYFDMNIFDFDKSKPSKYMEVNKKLSGNVNDAFSVWTPEINKKHIEEGFPVSYAYSLFFYTPEWKELKKNADRYAVELK